MRWGFILSWADIGNKTRLLGFYKKLKLTLLKQTSGFNIRNNKKKHIDMNFKKTYQSTSYKLTDILLNNGNNMIYH